MSGSTVYSCYPKPRWCLFQKERPTSNKISDTSVVSSPSNDDEADVEILVKKNIKCPENERKMNYVGNEMNYFG